MKFDQYLNGMIELKLSAARTEEILQKLTYEGIFLYQVKRNQEEVWFCVPLDDFFTVRQILRENRCRFRIQNRTGLPFLISRLKRRRGLWLGICTGFAALYLLLSFIWSYEVSGNVTYSDEHLIALVQEYGMLPGARSDKFDYDALAKQITLDHPEFTWIQLEPRGTTLQISVKERLADSSGIHKNGSLVARADGRITEFLVFRGTPLAKKGDWVTEGQVLVGGWDYPDRIKNVNGEFEPAGEPFMVEAQAVISGEQEHRVIGSCALKERTLVSTGREKTQIALLWKNQKIVISGPKESPYRYAGQQTEQNCLFEISGFRVPLYLRTTVFSEKTVQNSRYTEQEAYDIAIERARKQLQEQMPDGSRFIHESIGISKTGQTVVQVEVVWLVEENLARMEQKELPLPVNISEDTMA